MIEQKARMSYHGLWYVDRDTEAKSLPYRCYVVRNKLVKGTVETSREERGRFTTLSAAMEFLATVCKEGE